MKLFDVKTAAAGAALVCVGGSIGILESGSAGASGSRPAVARALANHVGLFERNRSSNFVIRHEPAGVTHALSSLTREGSLLERRRGLILSDTQAVSNGVGTVWAVPGTSGACVVAQTDASDTYEGCGTAANISAYGLIDEVGQTGQPTLIYGIVPNGNATVVVRDGTSSYTLPVTSNVVDSTVPAGNYAIAIVNGSGAAVTDPS